MLTFNGYFNHGNYEYYAVIQMPDTPYISSNDNDHIL